MNRIFNLFVDFAEREGITKHSFLIGGSVRDLIWKKEIHDYDVTISKDVIPITKKFSDEISATFVILDEQYGIVRVVKDGGFIDFSLMRGKTIEADLSSRDFTINAMAIKLSDYKDFLDMGEIIDEKDFLSLIIDPFNGLRDLQHKTIRMVSEENLYQDPLRILRAFRFSATLDFYIEPATFEALCKLSNRISKSAVERIIEELKHILLVKFSYKTIREMHKSGLLIQIFPELKVLDFHRILDNIRSYTNLEHILDSLSAYFSDYKVIEDYFKTAGYRMITLKLATLFGTAQIAKAVIERMKFPKKISNLLIANFEFYDEFISHRGSSKRDKIDFLRRAGNELYAVIVYSLAKERMFCSQDNPLLLYCKEMLDIYGNEIVSKKKEIPIITGDDLIKELNLSPSPLFKYLLKEIELLFLEGSIKSKKEALEKAQELFKNITEHKAFITKRAPESPGSC